MSKKTIVLADNSYTIRRIVELSFSEEQEIELITFETSQNLRNKLLELRPHVVLVDIKLPEFNGYNVCRFVQENESLAHTRVFLLKGGFEPIDEAQLQGLKYEDIITKPFDSNALVGNIKKLLEDMPQAGPAMAAAAPQQDFMPSSLPEPDSLPEIDGMPGPGTDISFSDVKEEIESDGLLADDFSPVPGMIPDDEILPSEEITQAQSSHDRDTLSAFSQAEDIDNPFADEIPGGESLTEEELNIKRNIEIQERELEIGSLTVEEINIKKQLDQRSAMQTEGQPDTGEVKDSDTSELFPEGTLDVAPPAPPEPVFPESPAEPASYDFGQSQPMESAPDMAEDAMFGIDGGSGVSEFGSAEEQLFSEELDMPQVEYQPTTGDELNSEAVSFSNDSWSAPDQPEFREARAPVESPEHAMEPDAADMFSTRRMDMGMAEPPETPDFMDADEFPSDAPTPPGEQKYQEPPVMYIPPVEQTPPPPVMEQPPVMERPPLKEVQPEMEEPLVMTEPVAEDELPQSFPMGEPEPDISDDAFADIYGSPDEEAPPEPETPTAQSMPGIPEEPTPEPIESLEFHKQPTADEDAFADIPLPPADEPIHKYEPEFSLDKQPVSAPVAEEFAPEPIPVPEPQAPSKPEQYAGVYVSDKPTVQGEVADLFDSPPLAEEIPMAPKERQEEQLSELTMEPPVTAIPIEPEAPAPEPVIPAPQMETPIAEAAAAAVGVSFPQEEVLRKIEGKLTHAIKEMLWEIVPPLAEKIIKDEIEALKKETENAFR